MRTLLTFFAALLLIAVAPAETLPGRLPAGIKPLTYGITLVPDLEKATFSGQVTISMEVEKPIRELVLNSLGLRIEGVWRGETKLDFKLDEAAQTLTIAAPAELVGWEILTIKYSGTLSERPQGLYLTRYQLPDGQWEKALVTQMEPADARRMFPCWDEPGYRASYQLSVVVPKEHTPLSNMPIERETELPDGNKGVVFEQTPRMSSYLVAFASARLESLEDEVDGIKLRILATPGKREQMRYAMETTKKVLPWFHEYFGVKYPLPKLDQVSFPAVSASGMENWGCIIYSDTALLFDEKQSSQSSRERVFDVVTHEIAHQWFGDLVTMQWWDDLWLNEGFASWMATKVSAHFNPTWKKWERAAYGKEVAMRLDARTTTHPVQQPVVTAAQAGQIFDEITYRKGQALLRMLESWLGEEMFRNGLRLYFKQHANGNTVTADLWKALGDISGGPVDIVARGWTEQPGFPLITITTAGAGKIELKQERFTIHQKDPAPLHWQIPVVLQPLAPGAKPFTILLGREPLQVECALPVVVNPAQPGYYRTSYEGEAWTSLQPRLATLPETDRLNLLLDTWAAVQAGRAPFSRWLELARTLRDDPSSLVGNHFVSVFGAIDPLLAGTPLRDAFQREVKEFLAPQWKRIGWKAQAGEDLATAEYRTELLRLLGDFGQEEIAAWAVRVLRAYFEDPASVPADLRAAAFHIAGRHADAPLWETTHAVARKITDTEQKNLLYGALAAAQDPALAQRALETALSGELPSKTAVRMVGRVATEGDQPELAWKFARAHQDALLALCSAGEANDYLARLARNFTDAARATEIEEITRTSLPADAARGAALAADEIRFKAAFKTRLRPALEEWIAAKK